MAHRYERLGGYAMNRYRFNPPPDWPAPPEGWVPPTGWEPDPSWPTPPAGWQLWVPADSIPPASDTSSGTADGRQHQPPGAGGIVPPARRGGLLGRLRRDKLSEVEQLREWISTTQGADALEVARLMQETRDEAEALRTQAKEEAEGILRDARDVVKDI